MSEEKNSNSDKDRKKEIEKQFSDLQKKYGNSVTFGSEHHPLRIIPTGSIALDHALGTGGWPTRNISGIFGPREIGKSVLALMAVANAQKMGMNCAWVAVEPNFDPAWATKHGVDVDNLIVVRPKNAETAVDMVKTLVYSAAIDLIIFDSVGAMSASSAMEEGGKSRVGGNAALISHMMSAIAQSVFTNDVCVLMLNQVRDKMSSPIPGVVEQPGGRNLEHLESIIVQLKRGPENVSVKINGEDIQIGQEVVAVATKNKVSEGSRRSAKYMFYNMETETHPFGVDWLEDLISTGKRVGIIEQSGPYYGYEGEKYLGKKGLSEFLIANPEKRDEIRLKVLEVLYGEKGK